ncbi:MAG: DUF547 domain-containing protein [Pseudomonadota bacterium]
MKIKILALRLAAVSLLLLLSACASVERLAIPKAKLLDASLSQSGVQVEPEHTAWNQFIKQYLRADSEGFGRLAYAEVTDGDKSSLAAYILALSSVDATRLSRNAQLAYWSNLYNAKTVAVILDHYPVESIRNIKDGVLDLGPWEEKRLTVNEVPLSLHNIEHGIVRPLWPNTPEIHYLLNCAALGCPTLVSYAYDADNVEAALKDNASRFINSDRGVTLDERGRLVLSKIYAWYFQDFGGSKSELLDHLLQYADEATRKEIQEHRGTVRYVYDWSLNDYKKSQP